MIKGVKDLDIPIPIRAIHNRCALMTSKFKLQYLTKKKLY